MFEQLFKRPYYVRRHLNAPLLEERVAYLQRYIDDNSSMTTVTSIAQYLLRIVELLALKTARSRIISMEEIESAADIWCHYQSKNPQKQKPFIPYGRKRFIQHAKNLLKSINCLEPLPEERIPLLNNIFERGRALKRHTSAPLLDERLKYLQYWADNGATNGQLRRVAQYLLVAMDYLHFYQIRTVTLEEVEDAAYCWATTKGVRLRKTDCSKFARMRFISDASGWLSMLGCLKLPPKKLILFEEYLDQYVSYMRSEQGLSENTIKSRAWQLRDFLINLGKYNNTFINITPLNVDEIIIKKHEIDGYSRVSVQDYVSVLRSFLKYAGAHGFCDKHLAEAIKAPRVYKHETLPYSPSWDEVKTVLSQANTDCATDIRDYAVILLLSVYGLRCSEVRLLCLDDIDWENELIHLNRAKCAKPQIFPLSKIVGEAILKYLKQVRQNSCKFRNVFLCMRAPYRPLTNSIIYQIVSRRLKPIATHLKHYGPHSLRHACATHLINENVSLKEISDLLGHQGLETTRIYSKVDLTHLREITEFDLGGLL